MQTAQINSPRFDFQATTPLTPLTPPARRTGTLNDFRVNPDSYATTSSFSGNAMRPVMIAALVIAAGAGIAYGVTNYLEPKETKVSAPAAPANSPDPSVPAASSVPATSNVPVAPEAPTAKDSPATNPLGNLSKQEQANSMPLAGHGNNHSSESMSPTKVKPVAPAKSVATPAKKIAPAAIMPAMVPNPLPTETAPLTPLAPVPPAITEPPVLPAPAPIVPPTEPAPL